MTRFLVVCEGHGGCDYSIGCGVQVVEIKAESMTDAISRVIAAVGADEDHEKDRGDFSGTFDHGEMNSLVACTIYAISESKKIDLDAEAKRIERERVARHQRQTTQTERAEYERLAKKYGRTS